MSETQQTCEPLPPMSYNPLELLNERMRDLILMHWESAYGPLSNSLYLKGSRYVSGDLSEKKSFMRLELLVSQDPEEGKNDVIFGLELNVRTILCLEASSVQSDQSPVAF